jgi:hypothetical protein
VAGDPAALGTVIFAIVVFITLLLTFPEDH